MLSFREGCEGRSTNRAYEEGKKKGLIPYFTLRLGLHEAAPTSGLSFNDCAGEERTSSEPGSKRTFESAAGQRRGMIKRQSAT
jgi:hypothetical protein